MIYHEICGGKVDIRKRMSHNTCNTLTVYFRNIRVFFIKVLHFCCCESFTKLKKIRFFIADHAYPVVYGKGGNIPQWMRDHKQPVDGSGSLMRCCYSCDARYFTATAQGRCSHPDIQPSLGMGYYIDFFTATLIKDLINTFCDLHGICFYAAPAVLKPVIDLRAFFFQCRRNTPPVYRPLKIAKSGTVDKNDREFSIASAAQDRLPALRLFV